MSAPSPAAAPRRLIEPVRLDVSTLHCAQRFSCVSRYDPDVPTVFRQDGFRFFFYSNESNEPPHVHVERRGEGAAKFWLRPIELARIDRMSDRDLARAAAILSEHEDECYEY